MKKILFPLAIASLITACGSSDSDTPSTNNPPPKPNPPTNTAEKKVGILTDGIISGVSYRTSSGINGITSAHGEFNYREGDEVSFMLGDVKIGDTIKAQARITPLELSQDSKTRTNLLVFLQSLDEDAVHNNGITIPERVADALKSKTLDFAQDTTVFNQDATFKLALKEVNKTTPVSAEQAKQNFQTAFYQDIAGVWEIPQKNSKEKILFHIDKSGNYTMGQATPRDAHGQPGIEYGKLNWNAITGEVNPEISIDTNEEWGMSHPIGKHTLTFDGTHLIIGEPEIKQSHQLNRVKQSTDSFVGTWTMEDHLFTFFADNSYVLLHTGSDDCGFPGLEYGKYSTTAKTMSVSEAYYDTTGCSGLIDSFYNEELTPGKYDLDTFSYVLKGDTLTLQYGGEPEAILKRLK